MLNIFSQQQKLQRLPTNTNTPLMDAEQSDEDQAAFDDDEEMSGMSWSGQPPSSRQVVITVSDEALDCWAEKIGIDEQGKKELRFKRLPRYPNKLKVYTEVNPGEYIVIIKLLCGSVVFLLLSFPSWSSWSSPTC